MKDFFARLSWVDYIAVAFLLRGLYVGYKSGIFAELMRTVGHLLSVIAALLAQGVAAEHLTLNTVLNESTARIIGFVVVLFTALIGTFFLRKMIIKILKVGEGDKLQRILGSLLGGARWIILLSLVFMAINASPLKQLKADVQQRSFAGAAISQVAPTVFGFLGQLAPEIAAAEHGIKT